MKLFTAFSSTLLAISLCTSSLADEIKTTHAVGLQFGGGGLEYKGKNSDSQGVGHSYLYYNYQFMPHYAIEVGFLGGGDIDNWQCKENTDGFIECHSDDSDKFEFNTDSFDYGATVVAIKTDLKLSKRNKLYAKVGAEFYDYQFELNRQEIIDEDGVGLFLEAGWEYRWDGGVGVNVGIQHHNMDDLEMSALNIGVSYAF